MSHQRGLVMMSMISTEKRKTILVPGISLVAPRVGGAQSFGCNTVELL